MNYVKLYLAEKVKERQEKILEPAHISTKRARKNKPSAMSLRKHWRSGRGSGSKNPRIREARKREAEATEIRATLIHDPKSSIKELFNERR